MPKKYNSIIPANANIEIEYGKHSKVMFSYPISWTYAQAVLNRAFPTIFTFFILAFVKFLILVFWIIFVPTYTLLFVLNHIDIYLYNYVFDMILSLQNYLYLVPNVLLIYLIFSISIPFILALNKNWLSYAMPKMGYYTIVLFGKTKEKVFINPDIENNRCIIPNFNNVFLNYEAIGDFNKYLKSVKIIAYDFHYHIRKRIALFIINKIEKNDFNYYAVFEFTKKPIEGYLECEYY